jgi:hypothetical protein
MWIMHAGITAKLSPQTMNSCYEIKLAVKWIFMLNVQLQPGIVSNFSVRKLLTTWEIHVPLGGYSFWHGMKFFQMKKLWIVITGITMQELFLYYIVLVSDFLCVRSRTKLQTTIHKKLSIFALRRWQTNTTNFTELHSHSTCSSF